jgi:hypothetical protein
MAVAQGELAQRRVDQLLPDFQFACEWIVDDHGLPVQKCDSKVEQSNPPAPKSLLSPLFAWLWGSFLSMLLDVPLELIGINLGIMTARLADRSKKTS